MKNIKNFSSHSRVNLEPISSHSRVIHEIKRYFTLFILLLTLGIGQAWALDIEIPLTNLKNFPLDYGLVTVSNTENTTISSDQLQVSKKTAKFKFTTLSGYYLKSISFTDGNSSKNGGFTCDENTSYMSGPTENVYTYTAPNTTTTEANFTLIGSGGTAKMGTIIVTVSTSKQVERLTAFGSISSLKIPFTSSAATSNVELSVPTSNAVSTSSSRISIGSGGKHLIVSAKNNKVIKSVVLTKYQQSTYNITCSSNPTGTFANNIWSTTASDVTSVDLTLTVSSTVYSQEIFVEYADGAAASAAPSITAQPSTAAANYEKDAAATALSVTATGNGTLTYQWYKNSSASTTGATAIDGATSASYTPSTAAAGTLYYYCAVTNTESGKSGTTVNSNMSGAVTVTWPATGAADVLFNIATGTGNTALGTASKEAHSASINTLSDFAAAGGLVVSGRGAGKDGLSTKLQTLSEKDADKYIYVSFKVADGYIFTINSVTTKVVAVSTAKTIEVALSDATTSEALSYSQAKNSEAADHEFEFAGKAYEGTVTLKIYAYGATDDYRMAAPLTISGTVAVKPSPAAPSITAPTADSEAEYDLNDEITALSITASGYPTPTYQWYKNTTNTATIDNDHKISGATNASYTPANNEASDFYYYCVASNSQGNATSHFFHVTVKAPAVPTIYTETTAMTLTSNTVATDSKKFTFSGLNLGETAVTLVLASAVDGLTLSEASVAPTAGAITDKEITVSYKSLLDVASANVNLYLKQGDNVLHTIALTYSSTAGIEDLTSISAATTWDWKDAADAAYGTLGQNDMIVLANADVTWDAGFNALAIAGKLQHYYRDNKYAQGHELKFNTTIPGRVTVTFSNTGGKDIARAPRITDVNGSYAPTDEADGSKNTTAKTYTHNVAAGDVLIAGFEMQTGTPANMLRFYKVEFVPTYTVAYAANGGSGTMTDPNAYIAGEEVTLLANTFTPASGYTWSGWVATYNDGEVKTLTIENNKFTMPAFPVTVTAQWDDISKVCKIGDVKYESLEAALEHAADGTIELIQNIDVTAQVEIAAGVNAVIDLAGKKIEYTGTSVLPSGVLLVHNGASLTINGSSPAAGSIVSGNKAYAAIALTKAGDDASNPATLIINGGNLYGYYYAITGHGSRHNTVTTIDNVTITTSDEGLGIFHPQEGTMTINNATITGHDAAIEMRAGTLVINDGIFTATATEYVCNPNGSGSTTVGAALAIAQHTTKKPVSVTINGGIFNGVRAINEANPQGNPDPEIDLAVTGGNFTGLVETVDVDHFVSGGTFNNPVSTDQCAENYVPKDNGDGTYGVKPKDGALIFKATLTSATAATYDGAYADEDNSEIKLADDGSNGYKFASKDNYIKMALTGGAFAEGDVLKMSYQTNPQQGELAIYDGTTKLAGTAYTNNTLTFPATAEDKSVLYIRRTNDNNFNGWVTIVEVTRPMQPMLKEMTINGRDVIINEVAKTANCTIPYDADLAALTIEKTIVWNAPATENSIVVNDGSAWIIGDNTYKLTDKDGDYTVYTITLTRDVLKHTVSFNTHGGSAVASELVEDGEHLAAAPADPTKEDYLFQYWSLTDGGEAIDVTTVTIDQDTTFHAVWASDGAIKLLSGSTVNHTNFITAVTATETVEFMGNTVNYAKFSGTVSGVNGVKDLTRVIAYNATTNKTKIQISAHNNSTSGRNILVKGLVEGAAEAVDLATIALGNKEDKVSDWIEFNNAANRTIYIMVSSSAGDVYFTQVKVIESGETPMKQAGEAGYALNLNKGRFFGTASTDLAFEGLNARLSGDYTALNSGYAKLTSTSMSFTVATPMLLKVTTNNNKTYYVTKGAAGTDNETAKTGVSEFELTAGTWYITAGASEVQITNIAFELPKCEKPTITTQPASTYTFEPGEDMTTTVVATVSDGGTLSYQWYNASDDSEVAGATEATLTTTTEGTYYVIVTNSKADHQSQSVQSDNATLNYRAINVATLSALSTSVGTLSPAFDPAVLDYTVNLPMGTTEVPDVYATATMAPYASLDISVPGEFVNFEAVSTVLVTAEDHITQLTYTVHFYVDHLLPQVEVSESTTWDWTYAAEGDVTIKVTTTSTPIKKNEEGVMANVRVNDKQPTNDATFNSQALLFYGENVRAKDGGRWYASVGHIKFTTTVAGMVEVEYSDNGDNNRRIKINEAVSETSASKTDVKTFAAYMPAGEITIMGIDENDTETNKYVRISKIRFVVTADAEPSLARDDAWLAPGELGTICIEQGAVAVGAEIFELVGKEPQYGKIVFETVEHMKPGKPYLFSSKGNHIDFIVTSETHATEPDNSTAMKGTFVDLNLTDLENVYYFAQHALWSCVDLTSLSVPAHRAYVMLNEVEPLSSPTPAPGRRRVMMNVNGGDQVATGVDALNASEKPVKMIIDGQLFILRGEKMYNANGQLVK